MHQLLQVDSGACIVFAALIQLREPSEAASPAITACHCGRQLLGGKAISPLPPIKGAAGAPSNRSVILLCAPEAQLPGVSGQRLDMKRWPRGAGVAARSGRR